MFTRFGKLQRTAKVNSEGLGLGLVIVKEICEVYGGDISVISNGKSEGSTFTFTMKLKPVPSDQVLAERIS